MIRIIDLYDLTHTQAAAYLSAFTYPWEALDGIKDMILALGRELPADEYDCIAPDVWVHKSATVAPTASIGAPCIIGADSEVRHCAYIRGSALIGKNCVIGNSTELKNVILFDRVQIPHYNYIGDSILGYRSHLGAGAITSNVKSDKNLVCIRYGDTVYQTGRKKVGAMVGDGVEVGCNSVLNPGTVIGKNSNIYPLSPVRGVIPADSILKTGGVLVARR